ncbi:11685_t:CDS:2, partial [Racocetra fulgida]
MSDEDIYDELSENNGLLEDNEFLENNEFFEDNKLPEEDSFDFYREASNDQMISSSSVDISTAHIDNQPSATKKSKPKYRRNYAKIKSSDDNSEDSECDDLDPLYHEAVATTNSADGSLQNFLIIKSIYHIIYNSLFDYWNEPIMIGLLASLLNSTLKTLSNWDEETRKKAKEELKYQYKHIISSSSTTVPEHA